MGLAVFWKSCHARQGPAAGALHSLLIKQRKTLSARRSSIVCPLAGAIDNVLALALESRR